eukprot:1101131-Pelagomonas_calceolata.AAC.1
MGKEGIEETSYAVQFGVPGIPIFLSTWYPFWEKVQDNCSYIVMLTRSIKQKLKNSPGTTQSTQKKGLQGVGLQPENLADRLL